MAIKLEKGFHTINIKFVPNGFLLGLALSLFGIILFVIINIKIVNKNKY